MAFPPTPRLPASRRERRWVVLCSVALMALFGAEVVSDFTNAKLAAVFVVLFWGPALVLHELGHAWAARRLGWHVGEVVIGFGKDLLVFNVAECRVRVKMVPVEGYVVPCPKSLEHARIKSALIYAAGPGAELLLILLLWLWLGPALLSRSDNVWLIAAQSAALAAAMGAAFNLVPFPTQRGVSDGLGILLSLVASDEAFRPRLLAPFLDEARRMLYLEAPEDAARVIEQGKLRVPEDDALSALTAIVMAMRGDCEGAFAHLERQGNPDEKPEPARVEQLLAAIWVTLISDERSLFSEAERACSSLLASAPDDTRALLLQGQLALARGLYEEAYKSLLRGYFYVQALEEQAQFSAYLALACARGGRTEDAERFTRELEGAPLGPALRRRVADEVGEAR